MENIWNFELNNQVDEVISHLQNDDSFRNGKLNYTILHKSANKNILLIAMHQNNEFESFQASNAVTIQVLRGELLLKSKSSYEVIKQGRILFLLDKSYYLLEALEDSAFLLMTSDIEFTN